MTRAEEEIAEVSEGMMGKACTLINEQGITDHADRVALLMSAIALSAGVVVASIARGISPHDPHKQAELVAEQSNLLAEQVLRVAMDHCNFKLEILHPSTETMQ